MMTYKPSKQGQTDLVFLICDQSLTVGLHIQDYKFLSFAVIIYVTLVNTQTQLSSGYTIRPASLALKIALHYFLVQTNS